MPHLNRFGGAGQIGHEKSGQWPLSWHAGWRAYFEVAAAPGEALLVGADAPAPWPPEVDSREPPVGPPGVPVEALEAEALSRLARLVFFAFFLVLVPVSDAAAVLDAAGLAEEAVSLPVALAPEVPAVPPMLVPVAPEVPEEDPMLPLPELPEEPAVLPLVPDDAPAAPVPPAVPLMLPVVPEEAPVPLVADPPEELSDFMVEVRSVLPALPVELVWAKASAETDAMTTKDKDLSVFLNAMTYSLVE